MRERRGIAVASRHGCDLEQLLGQGWVCAEWALRYRCRCRMGRMQTGHVKVAVGGFIGSTHFRVRSWVQGLCSWRCVDFFRRRPQQVCLLFVVHRWTAACPRHDGLRSRFACCVLQWTHGGGSYNALAWGMRGREGLEMAGCALDLDRCSAGDPFPVSTWEQLFAGLRCVVLYCVVLCSVMLCDSVMMYRG